MGKSLYLGSVFMEFSGKDTALELGTLRPLGSFELVDTLQSPCQGKNPGDAELQYYSSSLSPLRGLIEMWDWEHKEKSNCDTVSIKPSEYLRQALKLK